MDKMDQFHNLSSEYYKERFTKSSEDSDLKELENLKRIPVLKDSD